MVWVCSCRQSPSFCVFQYVVGYSCLVLVLFALCLGSCIFGFERIDRYAPR